MPELPEVETIRRQLQVDLVGEVIDHVEVLRQKSFQGEEKELVGKEIARVERKAKMIIFRFVDWEKILAIHLKMTGQLVLLKGKKRVVGGHPTADWVGELPSKHTRVVIDFMNGDKLFFNDLRVFGWMKLLDNDHFSLIIEKLPMDVVDSDFTLEYFKKVMNGSGRALKLVLLDQAKMGGIGNIYANDALFLAKIHPQRKASSLSLKEMKKLFEVVKQVIDEGIKYGGATTADDRFVNVRGMGGKYQEHFRVYERKGEKCRVCGAIIEKFKVGGRGTYYCPMCQV
jgi:formamidopyrimidine-DNA glycosylase